MTKLKKLISTSNDFYIFCLVVACIGMISTYCSHFAKNPFYLIIFEFQTNSNSNFKLFQYKMLNFSLIFKVLFICFLFIFLYFYFYHSVEKMWQLITAVIIYQTYLVFQIFDKYKKSSMKLYINFMSSTTTNMNEK